MIPEPIMQALKEVYKRLYSTGISWALIGSTNRALQGMDCQPADLDITVSIDDLEQIEEIFDYYLQGKEEIIPAAKKIKLKIKEAEVEFIGENDQGAYYPLLAKGNFKIIVANDLVLPCLELQAEAEACDKLGRKEKAEEIRNFIKNKN